MRSHFILIPLWWAVIASTTIHKGAIQVCSGCFLEEKLALLDFKASLNVTANADPNFPDEHPSILPSWTGKQGDCCIWEGVKCSDTSGRIVELRLSELIQGPFDISDGRWYLNISTFISLKELQALDLTANGFQSEVIGCKNWAKLQNLESLYLGWNNFNNSIIPCITTLTQLKRLSLNYSQNLEGSFPLQEFNRLQKLELLDLSTTQFSGTLSFKDSKLKNLKHLNLESTKLNKLSDIELLTSLQVLSMRGIGINDSSVLQGICSLKHLQELDLSSNRFTGPIPLCFGSLTSIRLLDLSDNILSGSIPASVIGPLIHLEYLSLSGNPLKGSFSFSSLANHSRLQVLEIVPRNINDLNIETEDLGLPPPFQLRALYLSGCNLNSRTRRVPSFLLYQKEIRLLDLSSNKLAGQIPTWLLKNNTHLQSLRLMNNYFTGSFLVDGSPKADLIRLDISNNEVSGKIPKHMGSLFPNLRYLNLSRNFIEGNIPESLGNSTDLELIDLSHNKLSGQVPADQIATRCFLLSILVFSHNNLNGNFPSSFMNSTSLIEVIFVDNNNFTGSISRALSPNASVSHLDIANNDFWGRIPDWIGSLSNLNSLDISANSLKGSLPDAICNLERLTFLDLSENQLIGPLPKNNCSRLASLKFIHLHHNMISGSISKMLAQSSNLMTLDLRYNNLSGGIPRYIGVLKELRVLLLGGNQLQGHIPFHLCELKNVTIMDLSRNKFSGPLPSCFSDISFGRGRQSAENAFLASGTTTATGGERIGYSKLNSLGKDEAVDETFSISPEQEEVEFTTKSRTERYSGSILNFMSGLDLSCNQLTGTIPPEIGNLSSIRALNLSHNYLQGSIPTRLSMLYLVESLDLSYNNFSGEIPAELTSLNFLSIFNVSFNNLSGKTPDTRQFANFDESNYRGNPGLHGPWLKRSCDSCAAHEAPQQMNNNVHGDQDDNGVIDVEAFVWSFFASYMVIVIGIAVLLCVSPYYRRKWSFYIDHWILSSFYENYSRCSSGRKRKRGKYTVGK